MDALSAWLQRIGLERYAPVFVENGIELDSLPLLNERDLEKLGVTGSPKASTPAT